MWVKFVLYSFDSLRKALTSGALLTPCKSRMLTTCWNAWCPMSLLRQDWWQICKIDENRMVQNPPKSWPAVELSFFEAWRWKGPWGNFTILQHGSLLHPRVNHQKSPKIAGKSKHLKRPSNAMKKQRVLWFSKNTTKIRTDPDNTPRCFRYVGLKSAYFLVDFSGFRPSCPKLFGCPGSREKPLGQWPFRSQASSWWKQRGITVDTGNPPPMIPICRLMRLMYSLCSYRLHRLHTSLVRDSNNQQ